MKKYIIIFLVIISQTKAFATDKNLGIGFQLGGGINFNFRETDSETYNPGLSLLPNCFIKYDFPDYHIGFGAGVKYIYNTYTLKIKKNETDNESETETKKNIIKNHFLSFPILIRISPIKKLSFAIGPQLMFSINSNYNKAHKSSKLFIIGLNSSIEYEMEIGLIIGFDLNLTLSGIDTYSNDKEKSNNSTLFNQKAKNYKSGNQFFGLFKIGFNIAKLIEDSGYR